MSLFTENKNISFISVSVNLSKLILHLARLEFDRLLQNNYRINVVYIEE